MGFGPSEVGAMSLWQFAACLDGWNEHHGAKSSSSMSQADFDEASAALDAGPDQMM